MAQTILATQTRDQDRRQEEAEKKSKGLDAAALKRHPILARVEVDKKNADGEYMLKSIEEGDLGFESRD